MSAADSCTARTQADWKPVRAAAEPRDAVRRARRGPGPRARGHPRAPLAAWRGGAFVPHEREGRLVLGDRLLRWSPAGYGAVAARRPSGSDAVVMTPPSLVALLRAGWEPGVPLFHP